MVKCYMQIKQAKNIKIEDNMNQNKIKTLKKIYSGN